MIIFSIFPYFLGICILVNLENKFLESPHSYAFSCLYHIKLIIYCLVSKVVLKPRLKGIISSLYPQVPILWPHYNTNLQISLFGNSFTCILANLGNEFLQSHHSYALFCSYLLELILYCLVSGVLLKPRLKGIISSLYPRVTILSSHCKTIQRISLFGYSFTCILANLGNEFLEGPHSYAFSCSYLLELILYCLIFKVLLKPRFKAIISRLYSQITIL